MKTNIEGHNYELANFEHPELPGQPIQFIQKEMSEGSLKTISDGTTNEEVLRMLIDRLNFLKKKLPSRETACAITKCEEALHWLESRTSERKARGVGGTHNA